MNIVSKLISALAIFSIFMNVSAYDALQKDFLQFEKSLLANEPSIQFSTIEKQEDHAQPAATRTPQKKWTFIVYMAADNDLRAFAANNIKQMASIGSNRHINIVAHLDIRLNGNQKVTRRYYIEKDKINHVNNQPDTQKMDSGDVNTLISCCQWAATSYPAENYALIFWNHGTGIIDPKYAKLFNPAELFSFNPNTNRLDLDRSVGFLDLLNYVDLDQRGVCWDTTTGNYLTNQKLEFALNEICSKILHNKFAIIGFDACLMSMVEVAHLIKDYSQTMVGSQEVELGTGWNYAHILAPFQNSSLDVQSLASHIVQSYARSYQNITHDFTQSAIDLAKLPTLERNIHEVATLLIECISKQHEKSVAQAIQASKHKKACTHFDEPSYIDLHHFYSNLLSNIGRFKLRSSNAPVSRLTQLLSEGKQIIEQVVFANSCGKNLKHAKGISIYFPEQRVHSSYPKCSFGQQNKWATFLHKYQP